jgi:AsmA protein
MKAVLKLLAGLFGTLLVLLVIAALVLPLMYDTEDLKRVLANEVQERTGRELQIDGALDFSVFPWVAVEVTDLRLGNAEGFGDQPFASIGKARVGVALIPLFRKQIAVDEITLDGLELALAVNSGGQNNWYDLAGSSDATGAPADSDEATFSGQRIAGMNIRDATVEFNDQQAGTHYRLSNFFLHTGPVGDDQPLPLELTALLEDLAAGSASEVTLSTTATIDLQREYYVLDNVRFSLNPRQVDGEAGPAAIGIESPQVIIDLGAQTLEMSQFELTLASFDARGVLSASGILDKPAFRGSFTSAEFSPARLMRELAVEPPATNDPDALQTASLHTRFAGDSARLRLADFDLNLDQSRITGEFDIRNLDQPKIGFTLSVDQIDLDRYLEPAEASSATEDVAMPRDELKGHEVDGQLKVGALHMAGLDFTDATVGVSIRNGKLRLNPLTAGFYGGTYTGDIVLDSSGPVPVLSLDEKIDSVTFARLVSDLVDSESLSGLAQGHVKLSGRGGSSSEVLGSLGGELGLSLSEGALEGINVWYEIRKGMAKYKGLDLPASEPSRTVFSRMQLDALVSDGIVNTRQLVAELPFLTLTGKGSVNLAQSTTDLRLVAAVRNAPELVNDPLTAELSGKQLPFRVSGPMDNPRVMLDFEALLKSEATGRILDKLGLGPSSRPPATEQEQGAEAAVPAETPSAEPEEKSSEDAMKKAAKGALFELLQGSGKDKEGADKETEKEQENL